MSVDPKYSQIFLVRSDFLSNVPLYIIKFLRSKSDIIHKMSKICVTLTSVRFSIIGSFEQPLEYFYFSLILWACYMFAEQQTMATLMIVKDHLLAAIFNIYIVCVCLSLSSGILRYTRTTIFFWIQGGLSFHLNCVGQSKVCKIGCSVLPTLPKLVTPLLFWLGNCFCIRIWTNHCLTTIKLIAPTWILLKPQYWMDLPTLTAGTVLLNFC